MPEELKSNLEFKQEQALRLIIQGKTNMEIAEALQIDRVTLWRWQKNSEFKAELNRVKNSITKSLWFKQKELLYQSIAILADELKNKNSKNRVNIALNILKSFNFKETTLSENPSSPFNMDLEYE